MENNKIHDDLIYIVEQDIYRRKYGPPYLFYPSIEVYEQELKMKKDLAKETELYVMWNKKQ